MNAVKVLLILFTLYTRLVNENKIDYESSEPELQIGLLAANSIAKMGINHNPSLVFIGPILNSVISPLLYMIQYREFVRTQQVGVMCFEALLCLTNVLAGGEVAVEAFLNLKQGFHVIETATFDPSYYIQKGAIECMANMMHSPRCIQRFFLPDGNVEEENELVLQRYKKLILFTFILDKPELAVAAANGLVFLTQYKRICKVLIIDPLFVQALEGLLKDRRIELVYRGVTIINNIIHIFNLKEIVEYKAVEKCHIEALVDLSKSKTDIILNEKFNSEFLLQVFCTVDSIMDYLLQNKMDI